MNLLTVNEVSEILKTHPKTIYQWAEVGHMPSVKLNGCLRFDIDDIKEWIKECKKEASSGYNPFTQAKRPRKGGDK